MAGRKETWYPLAAISLFFAALSLRILLPLHYAVWGPDTGENFYITSYFYKTGSMPSPYYGFGQTYTEFPVVYVLAGVVARLTGIDALETVELIMPFLTSLLVFPVAGIAEYLTGKKSIALLSSAFYAASILIAGHTSIIASDTMGEILLIFAVYFFIRKEKSLFYLALALLSSLALIPTYHLGTVMWLLFLYAVMLYSLYRQEVHNALIALLLILLESALSLLYWIYYARAFFSVFVVGNTHLPVPVAVSAPLLFPVILFLLLKGRELSVNTSGMHLLPPSSMLYFSAVLIAFLSAAYVALEGIPSIPVYPSPFVLFVIPTVIWSIVAIFALFNADMVPTSGYMRVTVLLLCALIVVGFITGLAYLVPLRVIEYLSLFLLPFAGAGIFGLSRSTGMARAMAVFMVAALIVSSGFSLYFSAAVTPASKIGATPAQDINAANWMLWNANRSYAVVSDHRLSSIAFGFGGMNATWEKGGYPVFTTTSITLLERMLLNVSTPAGAEAGGYIFIDKYMLQAANFYPNMPAVPVPAGFVSDMENSSFICVYSNGFATIYAYAP